MPLNFNLKIRILKQNVAHCIQHWETLRLDAILIDLENNLFPQEDFTTTHPRQCSVRLRHFRRTWRRRRSCCRGNGTGCSRRQRGMTHRIDGSRRKNSFWIRPRRSCRRWSRRFGWRLAPQRTNNGDSKTNKSFHWFQPMDCNASTTSPSDARSPPASALAPRANAAANSFTCSSPPIKSSARV